MISAVGEQGKINDQKALDQKKLALNTINLDGRPELSQTLMRQQLTETKNKLEEQIVSKEEQAEGDQVGKATRMMKNMPARDRKKLEQNLTFLDDKKPPADTEDALASYKKRKELGPLEEVFGVKREKDRAEAGIADEYKPFDSPERPTAKSPSAASASRSRSRSAARRSRMDKDVEVRENKARSLQHQRVFLRRQESLKHVIKNARQELDAVQKLNALPNVVQSTEEDLTVVEDQMYLADRREKQERDIQDYYKRQIYAEEEKYVDPRSPHKDNILSTK